MIGPVSQMQSREAVVDMLVSKFADAVNEMTSVGIQIEPVEVVNAALQYVSKAMKFCVRHSQNEPIRMRNQKTFCDALDSCKLFMLDETQREQVM